MRETPLRPKALVRTFADAELAGGKVKAFFDRVKVRDLYDVYNLKCFLEKLIGEERDITHKVILYYASVSACFPNDFTARPRRFANMEAELEKQLYPMLRITAKKPSLEELMASADTFITEWVQPQTDSEREYLERFAKGEYRPELVFDNTAIAHAASNNPEALWKLQNLQKMTNY